MNYVDLFIICPLILGAILGFKKGLIIEIASLLAIVLGIYGAMKFSFYASNTLTEYVDWSPKLIHLASLALTFAGIVILVHLIARLIEKMVKLVALGIANRIAGALFGMAKYLLILSIAIYAFQMINERYPMIPEASTKESILYDPIASIIPSVYPALEEYIH